MAEKNVSKKEIEVGEREGIFSAWINWSAELTERTNGAWFGIVRDVRGEIVDRVNGTIDWVEGTQNGMTRLARRMVERVDRLTQDAINATEQLSMGMIRLARDAGIGASDTAARAAAVLTRTREERVARAA